MRIKTTKSNIALLLLCLFLILTGVILATSLLIELKNIKNNCNWLLESAITKAHIKEVDKIPTKKVWGDKRENYQARIGILIENGVEFDRYQDSINYFKEIADSTYRTIILHGKYYGKFIYTKEKLTDLQIHESEIYKLGLIDIEAIITKYREVLRNKKIFLTTPIYLMVTSDLYEMIYHNFPENKKIQYNFILPPLHTGYMDEVIYQAYIQITFPTVYKALDKTILHFLYGVILSLFLIVLWFKIEKIIDRRKKGISKIKDSIYKIGHLTFNHKDSVLVYKHETYILSPRISDVLLLLVNNEDHSVSFKELQDMFTTKGNITTVTHRVRKALIDAKSIYELNYVREFNCYRLELKKDKTTEVLHSPIAPGDSDVDL